MPKRANSILSTIDSPSDLKKLDVSELHQLSKELRQFIIDVVSVNGGHFGASLGVVELSIALHYVFNTPYDQLIWDVGHQAYGHKILTGRRDLFHTNRKYNGLSGFPKRAESEYDAFGVGHSSTSIGAALGMSIASQLKGETDKQHIAVIGDGALTGGQAFEALNHAGMADSNILVVLNDNCMSIDPNVGALKEYLTDITTSHTYNKIKDEVWDLLGKFSKFGPNAQAIVQKIEHAVKSSMLEQSNYFESLNFRYFGPVDGHDVEHMVKILEDLKDIPGPKILHCVTTKGKGYQPAEEGNSTKWHAPGLFNKETGKIFSLAKAKTEAPKYQDVFGHTIIELAKENEKIVGITPAMPTGCSLKYMMEEIPDRVFDVGIAEQHAVTFSAGMATQGLIPFCNIYSSFMQRAFDQVIHDVAIQKLSVIFCLDRAGIVGEDGPTHHGSFDIAYFRCIPNMIISAPMNEEELRNLMFTAQEKEHGPFAIRYPRGKGVMPEWKTEFKSIEIGTGRKLRTGKDIAILSFGHVGNYATEVCNDYDKEGFHIAHYDLRFAKPLDQKMLHQVFENHTHIITLEDGCITGGVGSSVVEFMADNQYNASVYRLGIPDEFIEHGPQQQLHADCGYDKESIKKKIEQIKGKLKLAI
mgnify:FL=1